MSDQQWTVVCGIILALAALYGLVLASRSLRQYERDFGRQEASGINGPTTVTTTVLIDTERIRLSMRAIFIAIAAIAIFTDATPRSRLVMVVLLTVASLLDDWKSRLWKRAQRIVAAYERSQRAQARAEGHAAGMAESARERTHG